VLGLYLPPVLKEVQQFIPPQIIISSPVQIAAEERLGNGASVTFVTVQLSVLGLYLPPVFKSPLVSLYPPQTIISLPLQTVSWPIRPAAALVVLVDVQLSVTGLYLPPVLR
jgi:hypothetical protein